jgi:hypothetical protein
MKNTFLKTALYTGMILVSLAVSSFTLKKVIENKEIKTSTEGFAVLELFTSQGCSSCPPADSVLGKYALENNPNVIPLAFHVDYWDYIGWKDPFSKAEFSERQRKYSQIMNLRGSYTPQLVINGKHEVVGSKEGTIQNLVNQELGIKKQFAISIKPVFLKGNQLNVEYEVDNLTPSTVVNLALVKKKEFTSIKRGENSGLKQTNYNIVYDFKSVINTKKIGNKMNFEFNKDWLSTDFMVVAYLQNTKTGVILACSKIEIN